MSFGERLKRLREQNHISQKQMALMLGISQSVISDYESGKSLPRADQIVPLAIVLHVSTDTLLGMPEGFNTDRWLLRFLKNRAKLLQSSANTADRHAGNTLEFAIKEIEREMQKIENLQKNT